MPFFRMSLVLIFLVGCLATKAAAVVIYRAQLLHPGGGIDVSEAYGISVARSAGRVRLGGINHAAVWDGAGLLTDLHPAQYLDSFAHDIWGTKQVGSVGVMQPQGGYHAALWNNSAESFVDLHPNEFHLSVAFGVSEDAQVGDAVVYAASTQHAILWHGTAASAVDLHPDGFTNSTAVDVEGDTQVGYGSTLMLTHALLWKGTAESAVDLHPSHIAGHYSVAEAISGNMQAGRVGRPVLPRRLRRRSQMDR